MSQMLPELLRRTVKLHGGLALVTDAQRTVTARELDAEVDALAARLVTLGVVHGDRVAILARNRIGYVAAYFAAARLGAALVPVNGRLRTAEIRHVLDDSGAVTVLLDPSLGAEVLSIVAEDQATGRARRWVTLDAALPGTTALAAVALGTLPALPTDPSTVAVQMYTSGTTGAPKGAMLTHANLAAVVAAYLVEMHMKPGRSRFLQVTPLFHVGGLMMVLLCVACPCTLVLHPEFDPGRVIAALADDGITHTLLVPAMIRWVAMQPGVEQRTFPTLELVAYGAAPMPPDLLARASNVLRCDFLQGYGLTETGGVVTVLRPEDHRDGSPAVRMSAGREMYGCDLRVVGPDGLELPRGGVGEIVVRGPNVTPGYAGRPEATAEALRDGWLHTGDLGTMDDQGYVTVVDTSRT